MVLLENVFASLKAMHILWSLRFFFFLQSQWKTAASPAQQVIIPDI